MKKTCFVISPIDKPESDTRRRANDVFEGIIRPALEPLGYDPLRADHLKSPGKITDSVIEYITEAPMVIADLTDLNANVFYELSLRHVSEKPVVHIVHADQIEKIPFDLKDVRVVPYGLVGAEMIDAQNAVRSHVEAALAAHATKNLLLDKVRNIGLIREPPGPDHLKHLHGTLLLGNWIRYNVIDSFLDNIPYAENSANEIDKLDSNVSRVLEYAEEEHYTERAKTLAAFPGEMRTIVDGTFTAASSIIPPLTEAIKAGNVDAIKKNLIKWRSTNHEYVVLAAERILDLIKEDPPT